MVEFYLEKLGAEQEASITSGDRLVKHDPLANEADAGVWNFKTLMIPRPIQRPVVYYEITPAVGREVQDNLRSEWVGSKDPVTTDLVDSEEEQVQELIFRFKKFRSIPYHKRLADRLLTLFTYAKEEDPDSLGIAAGSLRDFYDFLYLHDNLKYPSITLSPDNNILASWRGEQNRVFSVHFLSNKDVRFVIFKPIKKYPDRKFRFSGAATIDTLMDEIPKDMLDWIT
jgi:hypothetical protein